MKKIINSTNVVKSYGEGTEKRNVLDHVNAHVNEGEFVSIMGPSGSGKSTLLFAMSGMDSIEGGNVYFENQDLATIKEKELSDLRRKAMGFVFQQPTMLKNLNILDNIILASTHKNRKNRLQLVQKAKELMQKVGIYELEKRDITQVSGGQLQRAGICRALMANPKILFADEPTGALNTKAAHEIMDILTTINEEGTAIMVVTHDAKVAARSERILFMRDGIIISELQFNKYTEVDMNNRIRKITMKMQEIGI